jgi:hypothetical protein
MAKKARSGEVSISEHARGLLRQNPHISVTEAIATLAPMGIKLKPSLFYFVKGKMKGRKGRRRQIRRKVASVMANGAAPAAGTADILATIKKVKGVAGEVGGLRKLAALVAALSE